MTEVGDIKKAFRSRGLCVVIPTYNNVGTIRDVVVAVEDYCADIIVVNDGSTDGTGEVLRKLPGIAVINSTPNRGKGHALKAGFRKALELGFTYAVTMDADGQHYASELPHFLAANQAHPRSLIIGSRNLKGKDRPGKSKFANEFSNFWFMVQTFHRLDDTQTGFRLYPLKRMGFFRHITARYEAELELLVFASWNGVPIVPIPIEVYYPPRNERVSHFRPVADFMRISILNTLLCVLAVVYGLPRCLLRHGTRVLRTTYSGIFFAAYTMFVATPFVWLAKCSRRDINSRLFCIHRLIWHFARFVIFKHGIPGCKFRQDIKENPDFDHPKIVVCNHQSHLDLMCLLTLSPRLVFLTNSRIWHNSIYGYLIRQAGYSSVAEGIDQLMPHLKAMVQRGYSIAIFPEGTRSADGTIGRFHQGAFYIAQQLGLDILPIMLYGTGQALPKGRHLLKKGLLYMNVNSTLKQKELQQHGNCRQQAAWLRQQYARHYRVLCDHMDQE